MRSLYTALLVVAGSAWLPQQGVFRVHADEVVVAVSVRDGNRPVTGLTRDDFEILDAGAKQAVNQVFTERLPITVTILLDTSGSVDQLVEAWRDDVKKVQSFLRPVDRFRVWTFSDSVREIRSFSGAEATMQVGGATSLYDAVTVALIQPPADAYRNLVIVFSDGHDTSSATDPSLLRSVAARSSAVLHVLLNEGTSPAPYDPVRGAWAPFRPDDSQAIRQVAELTGGSAQASRWRRIPVDRFREIFEDFRQSYVLSFTPDRSSATGWHDLQVKLTRSCRCQIRARRAYFRQG